MDPVSVKEHREAVPEWAAPRLPAATAGMMTPRQREYIIGLRDERELTPEQIVWIDQELTKNITKVRASEIITRLKQVRRKPRHEQEAAERKSRAEDLAWQQPLIDLPPGRYAIENAEGELRFYKKWQSGERFALYVQHGTDESRLPREAQIVIAKKILGAGVRKCAIRYGMEIGECSNCGRRLTNRISRELGIGPICGGRMFGDDFKLEVKTKRQEIRARGEDPNEELD